MSGPKKSFSPRFQVYSDQFSVRIFEQVQCISVRTERVDFSKLAPLERFLKKVEFWPVSWVLSIKKPSLEVKREETNTEG